MARDANRPVHFVKTGIEGTETHYAWRPKTEPYATSNLSFDLIGLPPSPEEVEEFAADNGPYAFERVVDRLLGSVHFGERWGRHWLDLSRYAETRGHEFEPIIPNAWQYRDYVIRAINNDVPYDRFLTEQIAGDLIEPRWQSAAELPAINHLPRPCPSTNRSSEPLSGFSVKKSTRLSIFAKTRRIGSITGWMCSQRLSWV